MDVQYCTENGIKIAYANEKIPHWVVLAVKPLENYTLELEFADRSRKVFNMVPYIGKKKVFSKLIDPSFFAKAHVQGDTVAWDEEIDIAPETLYEMGRPI